MEGKLASKTTEITKIIKKGIEAWVTCKILRPVMLCITNRLKPNGGVICAISMTTTIYTPNHNRFMPAASTMGSTTALLSTRMEMPSRKHPKTIKKAVKITSNMAGLISARTTCDASACGIFRNDTAVDNTPAQAMMNEIMQEIFIADMRLS